MAISAAEVKALREETGLPMMECKVALSEAGGDRAQAMEILAKKHKGKMEARSGRETGEGRIAIYISDDGTKGGIIELQCETAPVAKNEMFEDLATKIAQAVAEQDAESPDPEAIKASSHSGTAISELMSDIYGKLRETMNLTKCRKVTGAHLTRYIHHDFKSGVLIALDATPSQDNIGLDLCHHATFSQPKAIDRDDVPAEQVEKVRADAREAAVADGKPEQIIDKIVEGKVNAYYAQHTLMEQEHVKVSKTSVRDVLKGAGVTAVTDLVFMRVGA